MFQQLLTLFLVTGDTVLAYLSMFSKKLKGEFEVLNLHVHTNHTLSDKSRPSNNPS
jgi:predicted transcriptional regulator